MNQMSIRQAARWAESRDAVYRVGRDGQPDYMAAAVDVNTNMVLCMGFGDKAYDYAKANNGAYAIRVYTLSEVLEDMTEEDGERQCVPGARDSDAPWH